LIADHKEENIRSSGMSRKKEAFSTNSSLNFDYNRCWTAEGDNKDDEIVCI